MDKKISCKKDSQSADEYYECLGKAKDTIDFCYDQYVFNQDGSQQKDDSLANINQCVENTDDKFDSIIETF